MIKNNLESLQKEVKQLKEQLKLCKKTIICFADSYQGGCQGHNDWVKAVKLYQKCEDEMDLDNNE